MKVENLYKHDDFFRVAFSREDVAGDYITEFLDKNLVKNLDLHSLTLSNTAYVSDKLKDYFSDVVWECNYGAKKSPVKLAFLFEHKSFIPKYPHVQLLRYMIEIWEDCIENNRPITPIVPIIVYHNKNEKKHWKYRPFTAYFKGIDPLLFPYIPTFEYQLTDLTTMPEIQLHALKVGLLVNSLLTLQFGTNENFVIEKAKTLFVTVKNNEKDEHLHTFFLAQLVYILKNNELRKDKIDIIIQDFKNTVDMNAYDLIVKEAKQEGIDLGIEKGIDLGIEKGEHKNALQVAKNILLECPQWDDEKIANLANASVEAVKAIRASMKK